MVVLLPARPGTVGRLMLGVPAGTKQEGVSCLSDTLAHLESSSIAWAAREAEIAKRRRPARISCSSPPNWPSGQLKFPAGVHNSVDPRLCTMHRVHHSLFHATSAAHIAWPLIRQPLIRQAAQVRSPDVVVLGPFAPSLPFHRPPSNGTASPYLQTALQPTCDKPRLPRVV